MCRHSQLFFFFFLECPHICIQVLGQASQHVISLEFTRLLCVLELSIRHVTSSLMQLQMQAIKAHSECVYVSG